jgi:hypothetical protein
MEMWHPRVGKPNDDTVKRDGMKQEMDVQQGALVLMVLNTLDVLGAMARLCHRAAN